MANQGATSFMAVTSMHLEEALARNKSGLPEEFQEAVFCEEFQARLAATARTWRREHAQNNLMCALLAAHAEQPCPLTQGWLTAGVTLCAITAVPRHRLLLRWLPRGGVIRLLS